MPFAIDPVCGKAVDASSSDLKSIANGIEFPFCSEECIEEFRKNQTEYLYCPWKPTIKINPKFSAEIYGKTIYFCCNDCRDNAKVFVAIQTNDYGFVGIRIEIDQDRARRGLDNFAVVAEVLPNSPAAKSGLEKRSSILKIDGKDMNDYRKFFMWMRLSVAGQEALFELETPDGKRSEVKITLDQRGGKRASFVN